MSAGKVHLQSVGWLPLLAILLFVAVGCTNPDTRVEQKFGEAQQKLDAGETGEAVQILEELHQQFPERLDVVEFLAFVRLDDNDPGGAADAFIKAFELAPARSEFLLYAAQAREEDGDFQQAGAHYRVYLTDHLDDSAAWQELGRLEERRGRLPDAIDAYRRAYNLRPSAGTAAEIGDLFLRLRNLAQAHQWFRASFEHGEIPPAKALLGLLRVSMEEENWDRAQELVQELDRHHPGRLDATEFAQTRDELRRWRESIEEMERLRVEQAERAARRQAEEEQREEEERLAREQAEAEAEAEAERQRQARREAERETVEDEETDPDPEPEADPEPLAPAQPGHDALVAEASRLFEEGRHNAAARTYWRALSDDDSAAQTWFDLSRALLAAEAWNDAELTALEAIRRDPERQVFHLHYLNVIRETQPVRVYLRELERVHQLFPRNPEVVLALANTYARSQHSHQEAIRYYHLFLRLAPTDPRREQVEQSIHRLNP